MNIIGYVNKFKHLTFEQKPFNDVEAALFSALVYSTFEDIGPSYKEPDKTFYFRDLTSNDIEKISEMSVFKSQSIKILTAIRNSPRYKDVGVKLIFHITCTDFIEQFCAMTFVIPFVGYLVAYRGTDSSVEGWKENLSLSMYERTASQLDALEYLDMFTNAYGKVPFIVVGHSKGGNLAYLATLFSSKEISSRIIKSYSFDGTGFSNDSFKKMDNYPSLVKKMIQIVPKSSFVAELFETPDNKTYIRSHGISLMQHNLFFWRLNHFGNFKVIKHGSVFCDVHHNIIKDFLQTVSDRDKKMLIDIIIDGFSENGTCYFINPVGKHPIRKIKYNLKHNYTHDEVKRFKQIRHFAVMSYFHTFFHFHRLAVKKKFKH